MFGRGISRREIERLSKRLDALRELQKTLGATDVEMLTAMISMDDKDRIIKKTRRERGEDDPDEEDDE